MCHAPSDENGIHIPAKAGWLRDQLLFVNPDPYMLDRLGGYALLTALYQKARREPNEIKEMEQCLSGYDFDFRWHFIDPEYAPVRLQPSMAEGKIGNLARHSQAARVESRKVVVNMSYAAQSVYLDQAAQIGLLTTNKDLWHYNACHLAMNNLATASKLARERVGTWERLCPKYAGLIQGDDTYNFTFYGVGAPLSAFGRTDQL